MTAEIKELSEKLSQMYGVDAYILQEPAHILAQRPEKIWLAEDSGRISDLADDNRVSMDLGANHSVTASAWTFPRLISRGTSRKCIVEYYANHPTHHDAARMARVRCLLAIGVDNANNQ